MTPPRLATSSASSRSARRALASRKAAKTAPRMPRWCSAFLSVESRCVGETFETARFILIFLGGLACDFSKPESGFGSIAGEVRAEQPSYATVAWSSMRVLHAHQFRMPRKRVSPPRQSFTKSPADDVEERREQKSECGHANMPKNTAVPRDCRISKPAPVTMTSGTTPELKAKEVIRIGRSRVRAAATAASRRSAPRCRARAGSLESKRGLHPTE